MTKSTVQKIDKINQKIKKLEGQKEKIEKTLKENVFLLLEKNNAFAHDYQTLLGSLKFQIDALNNHEFNENELLKFKDLGKKTIDSLKK